MTPPPAPATRLRTNLALQISAVVAVVLAIAAAALTSMHLVQQRSLESLGASEKRERANILARGLELTRRPLLDFTADYSPWDDLLAFARNPGSKWGQVNLEASLERFKLHAVWIVRSDGAVVYSCTDDGSSPPLPFPAAAFVGAKAPADDSEPEHWFEWHRGELLEIAVAPIQPTEDDKAMPLPFAWLVVATAWSPERANIISELVQGEVRIGPRKAAVPPGGFLVSHPLLGRDGKAIENLTAAIEPEETRIAAEHQRVALALFFVALIVTGSVIIGAIYFLVVRPLRLLQECLATENPAGVAPLLARTDEFGHLARLIRSAAGQREALAGMLDERARLGRDLHDGVIQNLYATGMGLAALRGRLNPDQAALAALLDEARTTINETIRDVRYFIDGLEPETLRRMSFSDALRSLVEKLRRIGPFAVRFEIDVDVADTLTPKQRLNLLQVAREAMSNALRHGAATELRIGLRREKAEIEFEISDNGRGFDAVASGSAGQGLRNFAERAADLDSRLSVRSLPGEGTRVTVTLPG